MAGRRWLLVLALLMVAAVAEYTAQRYIDDVVSGRELTCKLVRLAMDRHVRDLDRQGEPDFPYVFDEAAAKRVIDFKQELKHVELEWAGARIKLEPWQQAKDWILFGWRGTDGLRRFRKAFVAEARKNGKTTDAAATALYCFFADRPREHGPQSYFIGPKKEQGKYGLERALAMLRANEDLTGLVDVYKENTREPRIIRGDDPLAVMTVWGRDAKSADGFNPSFALIDEAHLYPGNEAMEVIASGMGARRQPLTYIITTAGFDLNSSCYEEEWSVAVRMLQGDIPMLEHYFALIYTLDEGDDFTDQRVWKKANPNLDVSCKRNILQERVNEALVSPAKRNGVLTKHFNLWTQAQTRWIQPEKWRACDHGPISYEDLKGRVCYGGLDLSTSIDITAWALCFPPLPDEEQLYRFLYTFFIPQADMLQREKRDNVPYSLWIEDGLVVPCWGETIDYDLVEEQIRTDAKTFALQEIAFDPRFSPEISNHLTQEGFTLVEYQQGFRGMAAATGMFEKAVLAASLSHGGNPVMRWMVSCTEVVSSRYDGSIVPVKPKREAYGKRIDGVVASIMAYHRAALRNQQRSVYEDRGVVAG